MRRVGSWEPRNTLGLITCSDWGKEGAVRGPGAPWKLWVRASKGQARTQPALGLGSSITFTQWVAWTAPLAWESLVQGSWGVGTGERAQVGAGP